MRRRRICHIRCRLLRHQRPSATHSTELNLPSEDSVEPHRLPPPAAAPAHQVQWCMENPFSPVQPRYNPDTGVVQFRHMAGTKSAASRADLNDNMVMPDQKPDPKTRIAIMRAVEHQRSPFFLWLLGLHDDLIAESLGRISWKPLIERALELGLVDGSNKAPTARRAAKVWVAVRQEAALRMSRPATSSIAVAPSYPSRTPASWPPPTRRDQPEHASRAEIRDTSSCGGSYGPKFGSQGDAGATGRTRSRPTSRTGKPPQRNLLGR